MSMTVKLRKIGIFLGVILPEEVAEQMRVSEGDTLHIIPDTDGARLTPFISHFDAAMSFRANAKEISKCAAGSSEVGCASHSDEGSGLGSSARGSGDAA